MAANENTNPVGASPLAMVVNDNAGWQVPRGVLWFIASRLAPTDGIGAGENTNLVVNENAGWQVPRGVLWFIASRLAPTDGIGRRRKHTNPVGASPLAMVVNDNAGWQVPRSALRFIASKLAPTEAPI
ncbi:hypothetical protein [Pseudomonas laurylsulfatiphila]|uniref:hypothetical protein n=1 Tax=Pseudomonas laurylsulfatiphila TaxID=2011015 RepID=UPI003D1B083E